ncbi:MAG: ABC transporter permease [Oscillospiraceae bacterium]|nr:ABC transporter permease [Oscillospiraceae bacterium]
MINKSSSAIPDCSGYINYGYGKATFSEISEIQKAESYPGNISINAQSVSSGYVWSAGGIFASVGIISTDENYADFHPLNMKSGKFDNTGAVISENLANKLFKSIDIIGARFYLFDLEITVAGVYKPDKSFLTRISSDGKDYIIVPYSLNLTQNNEVGYLYIKDETSGNICTTEEMELDLLLKGKLGNYEKFDLSENKKIVSQFKDILFFLIGVILFIVLFGNLLKFIPVLMNKETGKNTIFYIKFAATIAVLTIIPFVASFDLYIPANFFPADKNILDIPHYINLFINFIQEQNIGSYYFYTNLYFWSFCFSVPLVILNASIFMAIIFNFNAVISQIPGIYPKYFFGIALR